MNVAHVATAVKAHTFLSAVILSSLKTRRLYSLRLTSLLSVLSLSRFSSSNDPRGLCWLYWCWH